jgi:hypothetical protein
MNSQLLKQAREQLEFRRGQIADCIASIDAVLSAEASFMEEIEKTQPNSVPTIGRVKAKRKYTKRIKAETGETPGPRGKAKGSWPPEGLGRRSGKLIDAMREAIGGYKSEPFKREDVKETLAAKGWEKDKLNAVAINLIDMTGRGELKRTGNGSTAVYTVRKLKGAAAGVEPSAKEKAFAELRKEIQVPRDADAPEDNG